MFIVIGFTNHKLSFTLMQKSGFVQSVIAYGMPDACNLLCFEGKDSEVGIIAELALRLERAPGI